MNQCFLPPRPLPEARLEPGIETSGDIHNISSPRTLEQAAAICCGIHPGNWMPRADESSSGAEILKFIQRKPFRTFDMSRLPLPSGERQAPANHYLAAGRQSCTVISASGQRSRLLPRGDAPWQNPRGSSIPTRARRSVLRHIARVSEPILAGRLDPYWFRPTTQTEPDIAQC